MPIVRLADPRGFLHRLAIPCLCAAVGCGPGAASQGSPDAQKVEQIRKTTSDYMKSMKKNRGPAGPRSGPAQGP
jgi:hypothetical protein